MVETMEPSANFVKVPVIDIHKDNFHQYNGLMTEAMESASFIAVDCVGLHQYPTQL
jgi:hypothetical protein